MKKSYMTIMIALLTTALVSIAAFAGAETRYLQMGKTQSMMKDKSGAVFERSQRISEIMGSHVTNKQGDRLGRVSDLISDEDGRISYLVIAKETGSALVAIPANAAAPQVTSDGTVVIDVDRRTFEAAPAFSAANYPDLSDRRWQEAARGYFGAGQVERRATTSADDEIQQWLERHRSY